MTKLMKIHLIAIGGAAMHNLALALHYNHHTVSGSDDEIYNPARDRLAAAGLLPATMGWHPDRISKELDLIILGMHARTDNPELARAKELGVKVVSYPEFLYEHSKNKTRVVIAGSHGKTTTTSMILHILQQMLLDTPEKALKFDFLVGAQLEGFDRMVQLSNAPVIIIEGDEYLSSPIDRRPKFLHYKPHISIITGIAWDHINVFPTFDNYVEQFRLFLESHPEGAHIFYFEEDSILKNLVEALTDSECKAYNAFQTKIESGKTILIKEGGDEVSLSIFGAHNMANLNAAFLVCRQLGISDEDFYKHIQTFKGAAKRLQLLNSNENSVIFQDFAHAPSKVKATIQALKTQYPLRKLTACVELHTFSSLKKDFLPEYAQTTLEADQVLVFFSEHTLKMKKLEPIDAEDIRQAFLHPNLHVFTDKELFVSFLKNQNWHHQNLLLMSSGNFNGLDLKVFADQLLSF